MNYTPKIPKDQLKHGAYYEGSCRNASVARWDADKQVFIYRRHKFGNTFLEEIHCPEDDNVFDVFIADHEITEPKNPIPLK